MKFYAFSWALKKVSLLLTSKQAMTVHITVVYPIRALFVAVETAMALAKGRLVVIW